MAKKQGHSQKSQQSHKSEQQPHNVQLVSRVKLIMLAGAVLALVVAYLQKSASSDPDLVALRARIAAAGGVVDCVKPDSFDGIRGLGTSCNFEAGAELVFIPDSEILSVSTSNDNIAALIAKDLSSDKNVQLVAPVLVLLHELSLGSKSPFLTYLSTMPSSPPDTLANWDEEQLEVLSSVLPNIMLWRKMMLDSIALYVQSRPVLFGHASEELQRKAFSYVLSRNTVNRFIPIIDCANHVLEPNSFQDCNQTGCKLVAQRAIAPGEQLTISYGKKSDLNLLFTYGFALGNNISALHVELEGLASSEMEQCGGKKVALHHSAASAVDIKAAECLEQAVGRRPFLEALEKACNTLSRQLTRTGGTQLRVLGLSRPNPEDALLRLGDRLPHHAMDGAITSAVRRELATVQRCVSESKAALTSLA